MKTMIVVFNAKVLKGSTQAIFLSNTFILATLLYGSALRVYISPIFFGCQYSKTPLYALSPRASTVNCKQKNRSHFYT